MTGTGGGCGGIGANLTNLIRWKGMTQDGGGLTAALSWRVEEVAARGVCGREPLLNAAGAKDSETNGVGKG